MLKVTTHDLGDRVEICVRDNGVGISSDIKGKIFEPFFTTKPTGRAPGWASISYDIITNQHGGTIEVDSRTGRIYRIYDPPAAQTVRRRGAAA